MQAWNGLTTAERLSLQLESMRLHGRNLAQSARYTQSVLLWQTAEA